MSIEDLIIDGPVSHEYSLLKATDDYLTRQRLEGPPHPVHLYPSEASVQYKNSLGETITKGCCLRQVYYRCMGIDGKAYTASTEYIFELGRASEKLLIEIWKQMGVWVADHFRFQDTAYALSGELDVVLREPNNTIYGVEVKSFYGYQAKADITGRRGMAGKPKDNHLLQTIVYAYEFRQYLDHFKMFYIGRDNAARASFKVQIVPDMPDGANVILRPCLDGKPIMEYTVQDILERYKQAALFISSKTPPPRDYELVYSDEKNEKLFASKQMSKSKYEKWQKGKASPGDWECSYCPYKTMCYNLTPNAVPAVPEEEEEDTSTS